MKRGLAQGLKGLFGVVALVENQGDVFYVMGQDLVAGDQLSRQPGEGGRVVLIARTAGAHSRPVRPHR